jgi:hypothetical protein
MELSSMEEQITELFEEEESSIKEDNMHPIMK